jgi:uncharacterized phiE125 gp8 family phage protein
MSITPINIIAHPLTLAEVLQWCYYESDSSNATADEVAIFNALIPTASEAAQVFTRRGIAHGQYEIRIDAFPANGEAIEIPLPPVHSINSVTYIDTNGVEQTLVEGVDFRAAIYGEPCTIEPVSTWPTARAQAHAITITLTTGYDGETARTTLPEPMRLGMLQLIKFWYDNRDAALVNEGRAVDVKELPFATTALWAAYKIWGF